MPKNRVRRSVIVVDRRLQVGIALRLIGWLGYYLVLFCVLAVGGPLLLKTLSASASYTLEDAVEELLLFGERLAIPLALTCLCLILHCLSILNRVSGPVYRLRRKLEDLTEGDLEHDMVLRPHDFLQDLASTYNETVSALRTDLSDMKERVSSIGDRVFDLSRSRDFAEGALDDLRAEVRELGRVLDLYRLPKGKATPPREAGETEAAEEAETAETLRPEMPAW
jgi:hypothetical protein